MGKLRHDLTGQRFGRLVILGRTENRGKYVAYNCLCDCGTKFVALGTNITRGLTKSCGCYNMECRIKRAGNINVSHKMTNTRLYRIWTHMKERCSNPKSISYKNYGAKGITFCDEWKEFMPFYEWAIKNGYKDTLTIDRIDVNLGYSPQNCRWADWETQQNNKSNNRKITYKGETKTITEWARLYGFNRSVLWAKVFKRKIPFEEAINSGVTVRRRRCYDGNS